MPARSTEPYELGEGPEAALLLHGFSGSPFDLRPVAEGLAQAGYRVCVPALPGHGADASRLGAVGAEEWIACAHDRIDRLRSRGHRRIHLVGFSAGGCLAIRVAADRPAEIAALGLLAPALGLRGGALLYRSLFRHRLLASLVPTVAKGGMDLGDEEMKAQAPYRPELPTAAARPLDRIVREARRALPLVQAPTLVLWGARDAVVPRSAVEWAARNVGSGPARLVVFPRSAHHLALDVERQAVVGELVRFFERFRTEIRARGG